MKDLKNLVLNDDIVRLIYYNKVKYIKTQKTFITDKLIITSLMLFLTSSPTKAFS